MRHVVATAFIISCLCTIAATGLAEEAKQQPREVRITAVAPVIWACPLENWRLRDDDGCDPIDMGTRVKIYRRNVRAEYPHGPFALIEYTHERKQKLQYLKDMNVTPLEEDDPAIEDLIEQLP